MCAFACSSPVDTPKALVTETGTPNTHSRHGTESHEILQVVGLSVELWIVLCCFLTVWPFAPFAPFVFSMVNVAVVVIVNSKVRHLAFESVSGKPPLALPFSLRCISGPSH